MGESTTVTPSSADSEPSSEMSVTVPCLGIETKSASRIREGQEAEGKEHPLITTWEHVDVAALSSKHGAVWSAGTASLSA